MAVKYFDKIKKEWLPFPGTVGPKGDPGVDGRDGQDGADGSNGLDGKDGKGAYQIAKENGYTGSESEFNEALGNIGQIPDIELPDVDTLPTAGSKNLVESGGVYQAIQDMKADIGSGSGSGGGSTVSGLTKEDADELYEGKLNTDKVLFYKQNAGSSPEPVRYLDTIVFDGNGGASVGGTKGYAWCVYKTTKDRPEAPSGGSIVVNNDGEILQFIAPDGWKTNPDEDVVFVWMSIGNFVVGNGFSNQVGEWSEPVPYNITGIPGEDGKDGVNGSMVEFIYSRVPNKVDKYPEDETIEGITYTLPDNSWEYQSAKAPWTNDPMGVGTDVLTEFVSVRIKDAGKDSWSNWSKPALWSVYGQDGKDGSGIEYIFTANNYSNFAETADMSASGEDESFPSSYEIDGITYYWQDNNIQPTEDVQLVWCSKRKKKNGIWGEFERPVLWNWYSIYGTAGDAGFNVAYVKMYKRSDSYKLGFPTTPLYYNFQEGKVYLDSDCTTEYSEWNIVHPENGGKYLFSIVSYVYSKTNVVRIDTDSWMGPYYESWNGEGSGEVHTSIDPDSVMVPVDVNGTLHSDYYSQVSISTWYGPNRYEMDGVYIDNSGLSNNGITTNGSLSDTNFEYTLEISIPEGTSISKAISFPISISYKTSEEDSSLITVQKFFSIVPYKSDVPLYYTMTPSKNQLICYEGLEGQYIEMNVYKNSSSGVSKVHDLTSEGLELFYTVGDKTGDDVSDWTYYDGSSENDGIYIHGIKENEDGHYYANFGHQILFGLFSSSNVDYSGSTPILLDGTKPLLYNVISLINQPENGRDGNWIEYEFYLQETVDPNAELPDNVEWVDEPSGVDETHRVEWYRFKEKSPTSNDSTDWSTPKRWSVFGADGRDGYSVEYIYLATDVNDRDEISASLPKSTEDGYQDDNYHSKGWMDEATEPTALKPLVWVAIRKKKNNIWEEFGVPMIWSKLILPNKFKSTVFARANTDLSNAIVSGGDYDNALPTETKVNGSIVDVTWSDGIPSGDGALWSTSAIFYSDSNESEWTTPAEIKNTNNQINVFAKNVDNDIIMRLNNEDNSAYDINWYYNSSTASSDYKNLWLQAVNETWYNNFSYEPSSDGSYQMISVLNNGVWSKWSFTQIKGEKGEKGDKGDDGSSGKSYMTIRYYASNTDVPDICTSFNELNDSDVWSQDYSKIYNTYISNFKSEDPHKMFASSAVLEYDYSADNVISLKSMSDPEEITTTVNQGENGKIVYYMGSYQDWHEAGGKEDIICTATSAPYLTDVHNGVSRNYIYNSQDSWKGVLNGKNITNTTLYGTLEYLEKNYKINRDTYWIEMNTEKVFFSEILLADNAKVGSAIFNGGNMFSQQGGGDGVYNDFVDPYDPENPENSKNPYDEGLAFYPNTLINFETGDAYFGRGSVSLAKANDGSNESVFSTPVKIGSGNQGTALNSSGANFKFGNAEVLFDNTGISIKYGNNGMKINSNGIYILSDNGEQSIEDLIGTRVYDTASKNETVTTEYYKKGITGNGHKYGVNYNGINVIEKPYTVGTNVDLGSFTISDPLSIGVHDFDLELFYPCIKVVETYKLLDADSYTLEESSYYNNSNIVTAQTVQVKWNGDFYDDITKYIKTSITSDGVLVVDKLSHVDQWLNISLRFGYNPLMPDEFNKDLWISFDIWLGSTPGATNYSL